MPDLTTSPLRRAVERRSAPLAFWMTTRPRWLLAVVPLAAVIGLFAATGPIALVPGAVLLGLAGWTAYLSWPVISPGARAARVAVLVVLLAVTAISIAR